MTGQVCTQVVVFYYLGVGTPDFHVVKGSTVFGTHNLYRLFFVHHFLSSPKYDICDGAVKNVRFDPKPLFLGEFVELVSQEAKLFFPLCRE